MRPVREHEVPPPSTTTATWVSTVPSSTARGWLPPARTSGRLHSTDFRSVSWDGEQFYFTATQAAAVRVLWTAWQRGTPDLGELTILDQAGSSMADSRHGRLRDLFRSGRKMHPAWNKMIVAGATKGAFRLAGMA